MSSKKTLFNLQDVLRHLKESDEDSRENIQLLEKINGAIKEDTSIEDMSFYRDFLLAFDVSKMKGLRLRIHDFPSATENLLMKILGFARDESSPFEADFELLQRLIFGSISVDDYEFLPDEDPRYYQMVFTVDYMGEKLKKNLKDLSGNQIKVLFDVFLDEQIYAEAHRLIGLLPKDKENDFPYFDSDFFELERRYLLHRFEERVQSFFRKGNETVS